MINDARIFKLSKSVNEFATLFLYLFKKKILPEDEAHGQEASDCRCHVFIIVYSINIVIENNKKLLL